MKQGSHSITLYEVFFKKEDERNPFPVLIQNLQEKQEITIFRNVIIMLMHTFLTAPSPFTLYVTL